MVSSSDSTGYVQSGYSQNYGYHIRIFGEFKKDYNTAYVRTYLDAPYLTNGSSYDYWEQYDASCSCVHANVNTTRIENTDFSPFGAWHGPFALHVSGEAFYKNSGIPGTASSPVNFTNIQFQNYSNNQWATATNILAAQTPANSYWKQQSISAVYKRIWLG